MSASMVRSTAWRASLNGDLIHVVVMEGRLETLRRLEEVIAGRPVGSISVLDAIEHFADGDEVLQAIAEIARKNLALVVVSVPNVTHRDIGAKLAFGRWNYTATCTFSMARTCGFSIIPCFPQSWRRLASWSSIATT